MFSSVLRSNSFQELILQFLKDKNIKSIKEDIPDLKMWHNLNLMDSYR